MEQPYVWLGTWSITPLLGNVYSKFSKLLFDEILPDKFAFKNNTHTL